MLLLTIEERFIIAGRAPIVTPGFPGDWRLDPALANTPGRLVEPSGASHPCRVEILPTHYNIRGSHSAAERWSYSVLLHDIAPTLIPQGSEVHVSEDPFLQRGQTSGTKICK